MFDDKPPNSSDLFIAVAAFLAVSFLGWQLYSAQQRNEQLKTEISVCRQLQQRTDQMIDKLRGFNR